MPANFERLPVEDAGHRFISCCSFKRDENRRTTREAQSFHPFPTSVSLGGEKTRNGVFSLRCSKPVFLCVVQSPTGECFLLLKLRRTYWKILKRASVFVVFVKHLKSTDALLTYICFHAIAFLPSTGSILIRPVTADWLAKVVLLLGTASI